MMKTLHLLSGLLMMLLFIVSGQYLNFVLPPLEGTIDGNRMMYRAGHIYLMMAAAINIACGMYYTTFAAPLAAWLQRIGAVLLIASQPLLLWGFLLEPGNNTADRLYTQLGCFAIFAGIAVGFSGWAKQRLSERAASG